MYGAGPSGCWEGFSESEAELNRFGRSLSVWCVGEIDVGRGLGNPVAIDRGGLEEMGGP